MFRFSAMRKETVSVAPGQARGWSAVRLWPEDKVLLASHYKRHSDADRRIRLGHLVSDRFLESYAGIALGSGCIVIGAIVDGVLRGVAEARPHPVEDDGFEAAFTVETGFKGRGVGSGLFDELMRAAASAGRWRVVMACIGSNARTISLAAKHGAVLIEACDFLETSSRTMADELVEEVLCLTLDLRETRWNCGY